MKLLFIIGTRPEAIKLAPIVHLAKSRPNIQSVVCNTGQHSSMMEQTCKALGLECDIDLQVMASSKSLSDTTSLVLAKTSKVIEEHKPDWVVVQGDTASAFAGGLAGFYNGVKVAHVEAGLRSFDNMNPFPEEVNRKLVATFSNVHFAPTDISAANLLQENVSQKDVLITGNTVIDALKIIRERIAKTPELQQKIKESLSFLDSSKKLILVTAHRRENHGSGITDICEAVKELAAKRPDVQFVFPVHLNPNVQKIAKTILANISNVVLTDPLDYIEMVYLLDKSHLILTDSGGLQEEASAFSTPVLVLRLTTERTEGINAGIAKLIGTDKNEIIKHTLNLLENESEHMKMCLDISPYGDGLASNRILDEMIKRL